MVDRRNLIGAALIVLLWTAQARSQQSRLPLPSDEHAAMASSAEAAAAAGNFNEAVQQWQAVLDLPEDFIDPVQPQRSLKSRVQERLLSAPAGGLAAYEQRFGPQAQALLNDALRDHDRERLGEVVRRYFGTEAGRAAALVFAQRLADDGDAMSAARLYDQIAAHPRTAREGVSEWQLRAAVCWKLAGFDNAARVRLAALKGRDSGGAATGAGAIAGLPADVENWIAGRADLAADGLADALPGTPIFRGNAQRNAAYSPAVPVGPLAWEYPAVDAGDFLDPSRTDVLAARLGSLRERYETAAGERVLVPAGTPVAAGGLAVFRGPGTVKAVSLATGKLAWCSVHVDDTFHHLVDREWLRRTEEWHGANLDLLLTQRMYRDATSASLSTDGRYVYALTDGGMMSSVSQSAVALPALADHQLAPHSYNRLLVFELQTGRLVREFGGPTTTEPLSGAYFLGAPLPLDGQLFCLVENQGQVQLAVLDQTQHEVLWTQALYNPNANLSNPMGGISRRLAGIVPSAAGDVVVCPTGETTVVAIDRRRRTILWTFEYQRPTSESPRQAMALRMMLARQQMRGRIEEQLTDELLSPDHWQDAAPVIDGEHVLLTSPDSEELLCLQLVNGAEAWRRPREDFQWIAAVYRGNVVLVGKEQIEALRIADGSPAWGSPVSIARPGGRGLLHGRSYVLPLATGEAVALDLETGQLTARTRLPESAGRGNLVAADGRIVCQTADSLQAFHTIDELTGQAEQRIAARADDAEALLLRGELQLHLGDEGAALGSLRRAVQADPASPARRLLVSTLIEGLRTDFDRYREAAPEIEQLASNVSEQALFHRLFASGLQQRGEIDAAFQQYLRFSDRVGDVSGLQKIDALRQVRSDLWIAGRLQELLDASGTDDRRRLQAELVAATESALAAGESARLATVRHAIDDPAIRARIDRQVIENASLPDPQLDSLLLQSLPSQDAALSAQATARLADRWLTARRSNQLLERLLADLAGPLGEVVCLNGRTGADLVAEWRGDPERVALIDPPDPWPTEELIVAERTQGVPAHSFPVQVLGTPSEVFAGWTFYTDAQGANLVAFDQLGQHAWKVPTGMSGLLRGTLGPSYIRYVATYGRTLLLVVVDQWTLFDALAAEGTPQVLANQRLAAGDEGPSALPGMARRNPSRRNRNRTWDDPQGGASPLGNVGPIVDGAFVYQRGNRLTAVSVVNGEELWTHDRPDLQAGGDIMSDGRTVVIWPGAADAGDLQLFRAVDGTALGAAELPPHVLRPQPEGHWGTRLVTLDRGGDGKLFEFGLFDPIRRTAVWKRTLPGTVDWGVIEGRDFYVLQSGGQLRIVDGETGEDRMEVSLPEGETAERATVWSDAERWYAATYRAPPDDKGTRESAPYYSPEVHGVVMAVSKGTRGVQWSAPVLNQRLHRDLPGQWPFIMLSAPVAPGSADAPSRTWSLLLLEKATGRILLETTATGRTEQQGWLSDPERHVIHLATGTIKTTLEFSPPSPAPPAEPTPQPE